jgi:hypothetical protein
MGPYDIHFSRLCAKWPYLERQLDERQQLWENTAIKEGTTMCWEREESKKMSEEVDEVLKKLVREAEKEKEAEVPAKAG